MQRQSVEVIPGPGVLQDLDLLRTRAQDVAPFVDWIQIDIADNIFVPNSTSLNPSIYKKALSGIDCNFELHMMINDPLEVVDAWITAGFKRVIFHIEAVDKIKDQRSKIKDSIQKLKLQNVEVGLAIDKETPAERIFPYLDVIDCVLVMTIKAGFSGQTFVPEMLDKVRLVLSKDPKMPIEVDGGINYDTARLAIKAGATRLAVTSTIYNSEDVKEAIERLRNS